MAAVRRASGCLFGLACGDALGAETEFLPVDEIRRRYPPNGPQEPPGNPARVTDDTQMALAVADALAAAPHPYVAATLEPYLRRAFVDWSVSPDNDRAPGMTCLTACHRLEQGLPWYEATVMASKGCGASMRVAPVGLLSLARDGVDEEARAAAAQLQAALTHGHPTALAASDLTAATVAALVAGEDLMALPQRLRAYAEAQRTVYHADWLGRLWQRPGVSSPGKFIARGWDECIAMLDRLDRALARLDREADPCLATGDGWIAEEAFATGLLCVLLYPDDPVAAVRRAALTRGDSDSIACLAGAFAGAAHGMDAWPRSWIARIEYHDHLEALGKRWDVLSA